LGIVCQTRQKYSKASTANAQAATPFDHDQRFDHQRGSFFDAASRKRCRCQPAKNVHITLSRTNFPATTPTPLVSCGTEHRQILRFAQNDILNGARARLVRLFIVVYVVMPEHVHLLISEPKRSPLAVAIQMLKQITARQLRSESPPASQKAPDSQPLPHPPRKSARKGGPLGKLFFDTVCWLVSLLAKEQTQ